MDEETDVMDCCFPGDCETCENRESCPSSDYGDYEYQVNRIWR